MGLIFLNVNRWVDKTKNLISTLMTGAREWASQQRVKVEEAVSSAMGIIQPYLDTLTTAINR